MSRNIYTQEQITLDAMVVVSGIDHTTPPKDVFLITNKIAAVMRDHNGWVITGLQADNVANEVCKRFGI